jgi:PadR family transcriptional regulator, regulatory protein PadR
MSTVAPRGSEVVLIRPLSGRLTAGCGQAGPVSTYVGYMCRLAVVKLTGPLERVLRVMLSDPTAPHYGYDLMKAARLPSGTLYPMLARLQQEGLVGSEWEAQREDAGGRPPRKYYRLTADGLRVARLELAQASSSPATARTAGRGATRPVPGSTH